MEMAIKNVCEVLILRLPTVGKSSIPGETVGGRDGGGRKTARSKCSLCLSKFVWGKLGFILSFVKIISKMQLVTKNDIKTLSL
jgi:hypothetical protein